MVMRYECLLAVVDWLKPQTLAEIGVHQGRRAESLSLRALQHSEEVMYWGFDLWEFLQDHTEVHNGKGHSQRQSVAEKLQKIRDEYRGYRYTLVQGDHEHTVPHQFEVDLVFIDGDHRTESIQRDLDRVSVSQVKVLDDVYWPPRPGLGALEVHSHRTHREDFLVHSEDHNRITGQRILLRVLSLRPGLQEYLQNLGWLCEKTQGADKWLEADTNDQV